jgi:hypothetical protein
MQLRGWYVAGVVAVAAVGSTIAAVVSLAGSDHRSVAASPVTVSPVSRTSPQSPEAPGAGPGRNLAARTTVAVDGSLIGGGGGPLIVRVGRTVSLDVAVVPHARTHISDLYIGIGGPGRWGNQGSAPSGQYLTLLHTAPAFADDRHFTATWSPVAADRLGEVELSVLYTATDSTGPELVEQLPVGFRVRG